MIGEIITLILLVSLILGVFIGFRVVLDFLIWLLGIICIFIVAGFFIGVGINLLNYLIN